MLRTNYHLINLDNIDTQNCLQTLSLHFWQACENYLNTETKAYSVVKMEDSTLHLEEGLDDESWVPTALKIASYFTVILPLIALCARALFRFAYDLNFSYISEANPQVHRQKEFAETIQEENLPIEAVDTEVNSFERFKEKCINSPNAQLRYEHYKSLRQHKKALLEKYGKKLFTVGLNRQWNGIEYAITLSPDIPSYINDITRLLLELNKGTYSKEEVQSILHTLFSVLPAHPNNRELKSHIDSKLLVKKVDKVSHVLEIKEQDTDTIRNVWFVPANDNNNSENIAKYTPKIDPHEIETFQFSQLLGTPFIPLTTKLPKNPERMTFQGGGTIQEFLNHNVHTIDAFLTEEKEAMDQLHDLPVQYLQLYLLQAMILAQYDGHLNNTFVKLSEDGKIEGLIDFDNERTFPDVNYQKYQNNEGKGNARIALMGLNQARAPLSKAMLILLSTPFFEKKILDFFTKGKKMDQNKIHALQERVKKMRKLCKFAVDHDGITLSCQTLFFELFTHEDFVLKARKNGIPDLISFSYITIRYPDDDLCLKTIKKRYERTKWSNFAKTVNPLPADYPELRPDQCAGEKGINKLRRHPRNKGPLEVMTLDPKEIDLRNWNRYKGETIEASVIPLFLKGTPAILARRIYREYPWANISIQEKPNGGQALIVSI